MDRSYMLKKYIETDMDVVGVELEKLPKDLKQEYLEHKTTITKCRQRIKDALSAAGNADAVSMLDTFEESLMAIDAITWETMFLAGAEIMERECAVKAWKMLEALLPSE